MFVGVGIGVLVGVVVSVVGVVAVAEADRCSDCSEAWPRIKI